VPEALNVEGPWTVRFLSGWGAPERTTFHELISWTDHSHTDIQHFSGTATYEKAIQIPSQLMADERLFWLDLGRVCNIAEVLLNGQNLGIFWKPPFRIDVSDRIRSGENRLEVRITNLWPNRLIGDEVKPDFLPFQEAGRRGAAPTEWDAWMRLAEEEQESGRYSKRTGRYTWTTWRHYDADDPLLESGLIGPVRLYTQVIREIT
ncbi:MAG TPA: glycosyl hydrolase family 43, partial [bacterium]|nr:glycosyl hydrolase family 43 [bacterium]